MNSPNVKTTAVWVAVASFVLLGGYQEDGRSYSCDLCRNMKTQKIIRFWFVPIHSSQAMLQKNPIQESHTHDWYRYSRYNLTGYKGWLGSSVACSWKQYRDDK